MVVGALVSYYAPSNRGFMRDNNASMDDIDLDGIEAEFDYLQYDSERPGGGRLDGRKRPPKATRAATRLRRKPLRAMAVLTSVAADFDLISDWMFFANTLRIDRAYRENYEENRQEGQLPYLIPPSLIWSVLTSCIFGTFVYWVLATEGRILSPLLTRLNVDKLSLGLVLFISVLVEDIPQVILTFLIEDYYEEEQFLSDLAVFNLMASLYDTLIKLAESFDQRHDIVETGVWCKQSLVAHSATVTDILLLPEDCMMPQPKRNLRTTSDSSANNNHLTKFNLSLSSLTSSFRLSQKPIFMEGFFPEEEKIAVPRIAFLTTSLDKTIRLWNIRSEASTASRTESLEEQCVRIYQDQQSGGFTCMAWVGTHADLNVRGGHNMHRTSYFLSGCNNGRALLWDLKTKCRKSYCITERSDNRVASIVVIKRSGREAFICGHESGLLRMWDTWSAVCLSQILGHAKRVTSVEALLAPDNKQLIISGSKDGTLKLWESDQSFQQQVPDGQIHPANNSTTVVALKSFQGHTDAILSVACVDNKAVLSGSRDGTARLWSVASGVCLRIFKGHTSSVSSVTVIDRVTFLTGSKDKTIKAWDALSGDCLRTFDGHTGIVTGVSVVAASKDESQSATTFLSCSADRTVKFWVLTAVSYRDPDQTLDHILDLHENTCRCFDSSRYQDRSSPASSPFHAEGKWPPLASDTATTTTYQQTQLDTQHLERCSKVQII